MEHTQILGKNLKQIAFEKAGVIKPKTPCITGVLPTQARKEIKSIALKNKALLFEVKKAETKLQENQNIVLKAAEILGLSKTDINLNLACRFEVNKSGKKYIIKDGAHNPAAIKELAKIYKNSPYFKKENTLIFACAADKDVKDISMLFRYRFEHVYVTRPGEKKQSDLNAEIEAFTHAQIKFTADADYKMMIKKAFEESASFGNILLVTGSFYLVSEVKQFLTSY